MGFWKKVFIWVGMAVTAGLIMWLFAMMRSPHTTTSAEKSTHVQVNPDKNRSSLSQNIPSVEGVPDKKGSPDGRIYPSNRGVPGENMFPKQADIEQGRKLPSSNQPATQQTTREVPVRPRPGNWTPIESITVEEQVAFVAKERAELPPYEVIPYMSGNATASLEGAGRKAGLAFISPVEFRMQDDGSIIMINRFSLQNNSELYWQPVENLKNFDVLSLPVITASYGSSIASIVSFEFFLAVNGQDTWHYRIEGKYSFQPNLTMRLHVGEAFKELF